MTNGTPKTMKEAIQNGLCVGGFPEIQTNTFNHVRDFLAQQFGIAFSKAGNDPDQLAILNDLWKRITNE